jgi:regulator of protease activity HflC (stomatin/prohibitin superfamily)
MQERELKLMSGWPAVAGLLAAAAALVLLIVAAAQAHLPWLAWVIVPGWVVWAVMPFGFIVNGPNQARVVQLFGTYVGTLRDVGFFYGNPFYWRTRVSLRVRTFETGVTATADVKDAAGHVLAKGTESRKPSKVNDRDGTPIEIAAVVVWKVLNPTEAVFQVDQYEQFVRVQSEAALRNLASEYPYDGVKRGAAPVPAGGLPGPDGDEWSLRGNTAEVGNELRKELHERFAAAGVEVVEARISYLAYAPEIASAMLQRQQAAAVIAARAQIVDAAVGMVEHALDELNKRNVVDLDPERRAAMVSNLMVVLCGHHTAQPVLNTGTLYN